MLKSDNIHILLTTDFSDYTDVNEIKKVMLRFVKNLHPSLLF